MVSFQQGLRPEESTCRWWSCAAGSKGPGGPCTTKPMKSAPKLREELVAPVKVLTEQEPSFGYPTVAGLLGMNKNAVQRIFQRIGWQVRKRPQGVRARAGGAVVRAAAKPTLGHGPVSRLGRDGQDSWLTLALVIDCHTRELPCWHVSRSGKATTAEAALEQALIIRFGILGCITLPPPFRLRADNGLVFTSRRSRDWCGAMSLHQEFITPHCPQQSAPVECIIRTL